MSTGCRSANVVRVQRLYGLLEGRTVRSQFVIEGLEITLVGVFWQPPDRETIGQL